MNILKKQHELTLRKETERRITTTPIKQVDNQTAYVIWRHAIVNSNLVRNCRNIHTVYDDKPVTLSTKDRPRSFDDFKVAVPKRHVVQVSYDKEVHLQHISDSIGRQMARVIDDSIEERRYYGSTLVIVNPLEVTISTDAETEEKIIQIFFNFDVI